MAYDTAGLRMMRSGIINEFVLDTVDSVATAAGANYITDAGPTDVLPGKGLQEGDIVIIRVVDAIAASQSVPASVTDVAYAFVSAVNATTGAGSLTLSHAN